MIKKYDEIITSHIRLSLKTILSTLEAQLSPKEILHILNNVSVSNLDALPSVLTSASNAKLSPKEITFLIINFSNKTKFLSGEALPAALDAKLSPKDIINLFGGISKKNGARYAEYAFKALPSALKAKLSPEQIIHLFKAIPVKAWAGDDINYSPSEVFKALPKAFEAAIAAKIAPLDIADLFEEILDKARWKSAKYFNLLPEVIDKAVKENKISNKEIMEMLVLES